MPAGEHPILNQTRQAVERRAHLLLEQLQEIGGACYRRGDDRSAARVAGVGGGTPAPGAQPAQRDNGAIENILKRYEDAPKVR